MEFLIHGAPISAQGSKDAKRFWQERIGDHARAAFSNAQEVRIAETVGIRVAYFYVEEAAAVLDNIVKPIQDALNGVAYDDDRQVKDLVASMRRKTEMERITDMPPLLAAGLRGIIFFMYVAVVLTTEVEVLR